jgi:hypothetical protein
MVEDLYTLYGCGDRTGDKNATAGIFRSELLSNFRIIANWARSSVFFPCLEVVFYGLF